MKKLSLVLGGGAARGYVHIGVLKYLEEKSIKINEISGTSMGAILGALIALGKSSEEITKIAKDINIMRMLDFDFSLGLLKGDKIEKFFKDIFQGEKIENAKIPLKIIATDIENNNVKVFTKGYIYEAVRASISLPGVFRPKMIENKSYVDGGILMNLPIEVLDGNDVLAVSALKITSGPIVQTKKVLGFNFKSGFWKNNYEIIKRSVVMMMEVNEKRSLETKGKNITLIRSNFKELDMLDFDKVEDFVKIGYEATKSILN